MLEDPAGNTFTRLLPPRLSGLENKQDQPIDDIDSLLEIIAG